MISQGPVVRKGNETIKAKAMRKGKLTQASGPDVTWWMLGLIMQLRSKHLWTQPLCSGKDAVVLGRMNKHDNMSI